VETFGRGILRDDGSIDRKRLGEIVFADPRLRERLGGDHPPRDLEAMKEAITGFEREGHRVVRCGGDPHHESGKRGCFER